MSTTSNIVDKLRLLVERLARYGEAPAGTRSEYLLAKEIKSLFEEEAGVDARLIPLPVNAWVDEGSLVHACGREVRAAAWPGHAGSEVEGEAVAINSIDDLWKRSVEGRIVVAELPRDPDRTLVFYNAARRRGAAGIVFYDWLSGRFRRIVVSDAPLTLESTGLASIPVVHVRREYAHDILSCRELRLVHGGRMESSYGYIVEAILELGSGDHEVIVSAHHDNWFSGANDNLSGVAAVLAVAKLAQSLAGASGRIRLVSFTAEEFGDPRLPGWYWAYGSREYAAMLKAAGLLDDVVAVLNFDMAAVHGASLYSTPMLRRILVRLADSLGLEFASVEPDTTDSDSFSFSSIGLEAATIMGYDTWLELYHTDMDTPARLDYEVLALAVRLYAEASIELLKKGWRLFSYNDYVKELHDSLRVFPPLAASLYKLQRITEAAESRGLYRLLGRAYRMLNAVLPVTVYSEKYSGDVELESYTALPLLYLRDLDILQAARDAAKKGDCERVLSAIRGLDVFRATVRGGLVPAPAGLPGTISTQDCRSLARAISAVERAARRMVWMSSTRAAESLEEVYSILAEAIESLG
ncbi:MAG TPA: M28 family peptidase [Pyrodictium delaneyi]|uniref:M28 family peptidase n=1 Tax=Pyrodictium delaneyi TaxID=1273541 RepID=A0A833E8H0_9CREN|nr:M28 family peptidase [Pyrodictium delaneyi]